MKKTAYSGYQAYGYLSSDELGLPTLPPETERVASTSLSLSPEEEKRVAGILENEVIVSFHDHPTLWPSPWEPMIQYRRAGRDVMAYRGLSVSGMDGVFDGFSDGTGLIFSNHGWKWDEIVHDVGMRLCDLAHQEYVVVALTGAAVRQAKASGQLALILCTESLTPIENELDRLDVLYGFGLRCMGLVYSESNALGSGLREAKDGGLTSFGKKAVKRLNDLGVIIDVSHASDQTCLDAISASRSPVCITHAGARALWNTPRMKPDEVLLACARSGGVIGIEAAPHTTLTRDHRLHSIDSVMGHVEYCIELVGVEHVALGPDTFYGDHVAVHQMFSKVLSIDESHAGEEFEAVEFVDGMENPSEAMRNACRWLVKKGYSNDDIALVMGGNVLRVMDAVLDGE